MQKATLFYTDDDDEQMMNVLSGFKRFLKNFFHSFNVFYFFSDVSISMT